MNVKESHVGQSYVHKHWHVHAIWLIGLLISVNAWNLIHLPNGSNVKEFISFAASLASLLLAIVAIFYSFVSNRDFTINIAKFGSAAERTEAASQNVLQTTDKLNALFEAVRTDFGEIQPTVKAVSSQVTEIQSILGSEKTNQKYSPRGDAQLPGANLDASTNGGVVTLYLILRAEEEKKSFDIKKVFPEDSGWQGYCAGFLGAIETLGALDIKITSNSSQFSVMSIGQLDAAEVREFINSRPSNDKVKKQFELIDSFFCDN